MKLAFAAAAVAAVVVASPAFAADGSTDGKINWYGNVGYTETDFGGGVDLGTVTGRIGARSTHFGIEGEGAFGVTSKDVSGVSVKENDEYALDAVAFLPINGDSDVFIRAGYGRMDLKASAGGFSVSEGDNAWNAGIGAQTFMGKNGARLEYTYYDLSNGGGHVNAFSLSYVRKF
ncbi:MAG TPA: outer membrane beta-barrel protein [Caulobacteraceae bacterium]|jgi:hypothetical protein